MATFSPKRLYTIRRMRKARRLWKKEPLLAFTTMLTLYPIYTEEEFLRDLKRRTKRKKKKPKEVLRRYGRFEPMMQLLNKYEQTGDASYALQAATLRRNMTKPYRVSVKIAGITKEYVYSPLINWKGMEIYVSNIKKCQSWGEFEALEKKSHLASHFK